jgi:hypothetical protein
VVDQFLSPLPHALLPPLKFLFQSSFPLYKSEKSNEETLNAWSISRKATSGEEEQHNPQALIPRTTAHLGLST